MENTGNFYSERPLIQHSVGEYVNRQWKSSVDYWDSRPLIGCNVAEYIFRWGYAAGYRRPYNKLFTNNPLQWLNNGDLWVSSNNKRCNKNYVCISNTLAHIGGDGGVAPPLICQGVRFRVNCGLKYGILRRASSTPLHFKECCYGPG